jgi:hypothetical protein
MTTTPERFPARCPDCDSPPDLTVHRRGFLQSVAAAAAGSTLPVWAVPKVSADARAPKRAAETAVKALYETLTPEQKKVICFPWDHTTRDRGLLRTHVSNNWQITKPQIASSFYTKKQQALLHDVFKGLFNPSWYPKFLKQLKDDTGGKSWGAEQSVALFGTPGSAKFEFVMTGRHMTVRADGNSEDHVALGGPIFHGHAAQGFIEKKNHPGNIFWHQAQEANKVFAMLDGKQRDKALVENRPGEDEVDFRGAGPFPGLPVTDMTSDQRGVIQRVLKSLVEPYRPEDQDEIMACLKKQGGLEKCALAFYKEGDIGDDGVWDNWRLEGPSFVWYFRGEPHVHIWINVADNASVPLNARG